MTPGGAGQGSEDVVPLGHLRGDVFGMLGEGESGVEGDPENFVVAVESEFCLVDVDDRMQFCFAAVGRKEGDGRFGRRELKFEFGEVVSQCFQVGVEVLGDLVDFVVAFEDGDVVGVGNESGSEGRLGEVREIGVEEAGGQDRSLGDSGVDNPLGGLVSFVQCRGLASTEVVGEPRDERWVERAVVDLGDEFGDVHHVEGLRHVERDDDRAVGRRIVETVGDRCGEMKESGCRRVIGAEAVLVLVGRESGGDGGQKEAFNSFGDRAQERDGSVGGAFGWRFSGFEERKDVGGFPVPRDCP